MYPENYVTSNRSSGSGDNLKLVIQKTNATAKTDVCKEVYHVQFVMRKPKDYVQCQLPERISSSENVCNILPQNLTDNPNRKISVERQQYPAANKNVSMERAVMLGNRNLSIATITNPDPWLPKKTRDVSRSESDGRSALAEKVWERHYLARFYADFSQIKETNSIWQDMFEITVMFCVLDISVMNLNNTACLIKGIIWLLR